jgi:septum site-determining protein MinD
MVKAVAPTGTVAVAGGKGGSGKTTATLGLAAGLAARGYRPVAVDADVDLPDLHIRAGIPLEPGLAAVPGGRPSPVARESDRFPGVDVIPAGSGPVDLGAALADAAALDRPVVIDCPAGAGPDAAAPLRIADAAVLVCSTTPHSRRDASKTARMARALEAPPVAWVERDRGGDASATSSARDGPTVEVPTVERRPLTARAVLEAFDRLAGVVVDA